jgi:hypothetical protein
MTDKYKRETVKFLASSSLPAIIDKYKSNPADRFKYILIARNLRNRLQNVSNHRNVVSKLDSFLKEVGFNPTSSNLNHNDTTGLDEAE